MHELGELDYILLFISRLSLAISYFFLTLRSLHLELFVIFNQFQLKINSESLNVVISQCFQNIADLIEERADFFEGFLDAWRQLRVEFLKILLI